MTKVYVSGRMSGLSKEEIRERFGRGEEYLRGKGCKVSNPAKWFWFLRFFPYRFCLAFDLFMMCFCDRVYMLDGWTLSDGATAENQFARSIGLIVEYEN